MPTRNSWSTKTSAHLRTALPNASTLSHRLVEMGIKKGDRVAIVSRNLPQWITSFWAAAICGAVVVPLNAWWSSDELAYGLADSGTTVVFVDEERLERLQPTLDELSELSTVVVISDDVNRAPQLGHAHSRIRIMSYDDVLGAIDPEVTLPDVAIGADDDATMFYTSGTTGRPRVRSARTATPSPT